MTTPRWVGLIFQRPEMHRIHHEHGRHRNNYGDIHVVGHAVRSLRESGALQRDLRLRDDAREQRLGDMLRWRDVHRD